MSYQTNKRWRKKHPSTWQATKQRYYKQFEAKAHNKHQRYTTKEDNIIVKKRYLDRIIANKLGRSVKAIQIRRTRLRRKR